MRRSSSETLMFSVVFWILCSWLPCLADWQVSCSRYVVQLQQNICHRNDCEHEWQSTFCPKWTWGSEQNFLRRDEYVSLHSLPRTEPWKKLYMVNWCVSIVQGRPIQCHESWYRLKVHMRLPISLLLLLYACLLLFTRRKDLLVESVRFLDVFIHPISFEAVARGFPWDYRLLKVCLKTVSPRNARHGHVPAICENRVIQ